jgi:hypothetical protein
LKNLLLYFSVDIDIIAVQSLAVASQQLLCQFCWQLWISKIVVVTVVITIIIIIIILHLILLAGIISCPQLLGMQTKCCST